MSILSSPGNLVKVGLVSTCVLSVAIALKLSVPLISDFAASDVSSFWNVILRWLKPPYLYLVINCIIISIVASSKLQQKDKNNPSGSSQTELLVAQEKVLLAEVRTGYALDYDDMRELVNVNPTLENERVYRQEQEKEVEVEKKVNDETMIMDGGDELGIVATRQSNDSMEFLDVYEKEKQNQLKQKQKPPVSARFGHRKVMKASPEVGKAILKVSKPKKQDTLESTWKTITEGRAMPLARHLKKSDTWDTHLRRQNTPPPPPKMKKAETFSDRATATANINNAPDAHNNSGTLKREPSLSQDELNRRVEAFIKKFNEEMRLQRQRSLEQYNEMIRRGAN